MTTCTRFVNELVDILNELMAIKASEGLCSYHGVNLGYYCKDCSKVLCCECVMFGDRGGNSKTASWDHSKHNITRID